VGISPIRKLIAGDYPIEEDLVVAGKDLMYMYISRTASLFLKLVESFNMYWRSTCTTRHPTGRRRGSRRKSARTCQECRNNYENIFFWIRIQEGDGPESGALCVPTTDESCVDPVHPLHEGGYNRIIDLMYGSQT
jgi:hypothetical protein